MWKKCFIKKLKKMKKLGFLFCAILIALFSFGSDVAIPVFTHNYVNDYGSMLSEAEEHNLNTMLKNYQDSTSNQLIVLTLTSFNDQTDGPLFDFSKAVFTSWGIGQKAKNNGVLLVIVKTLASKRAPGLRIVTGYGAEGPLPDLVCKRIVESIRPSINEGNYYQGINSALNLMIVHLKGEFKADGKEKTEGLSTWAMFLIGLIILVVIGLIVYALSSTGENDDESSPSNDSNSDDYHNSRRNSRSGDRDDDNNSNIFIASSFMSGDSSSDYSSGGDSGGSDSGCDCGGGDSGGGGGGD